MASKKNKAAPTDEELLAQFEGLGDEEASTKKAPKSTGGRGSRSSVTPQQQSEADLLAEFENLAERPKSRPHTPRQVAPAATQQSPKRNSTATPPIASTRTSEEKPTVQARKSGESTRSFHQSFTPAESEPEPEPEKRVPPPVAEVQSGGGGWWGGLVGAASAAVKQAEALAKEIQKNEEAQRWAEQVKGNVGALRGFGTSPLHLSTVTYANCTFQVVSSAPAPSPPSPTSSTPLLLPSPPTNAFRSTSRTTSLATPPSTPSSTRPSRASWHKSKAAI